MQKRGYLLSRALWRTVRNRRKHCLATASPACRCYPISLQSLLHPNKSRWRCVLNPNPGIPLSSGFAASSPPGIHPHFQFRMAKTFSQLLVLTPNKTKRQPRPKSVFNFATIHVIVARPQEQWTATRKLVSRLLSTFTKGSPGSTCRPSPTPTRQIPRQARQHASLNHLSIQPVFPRHPGKT